MRQSHKAWQRGGPHHQGLGLRHRRLAARALCRDGRAGSTSRPTRPCREGHRDEAVAAVATATEEVCRFIARLLASRLSRTALPAGLNLRRRPANTPRGRNGPRRYGRPMAASRPIRIRSSAQETCPSMAKITFIQPDGTEQVVDAEPGMTVMEAAKKNLVDGHRGRMRRGLLLRDLPRLCRRGLAREDRRALGDGGGHARLRLRRAPLEPPQLPDQGHRRPRRPHRRRCRRSSSEVRQRGLLDRRVAGKISSRGEASEIRLTGERGLRMLWRCRLAVLFVLGGRGERLVAAGPAQQQRWAADRSQQRGLLSGGLGGDGGRGAPARRRGLQAPVEDMRQRARVHQRHEGGVRRHVLHAAARRMRRLGRGQVAAMP